MSIKEKLQRFKSDLVSEKKPDVSPQREGIETAWRHLQAEPFLFDGQRTWVREVSYPLQTKHGRYRFSNLHEALSAWQQFSYGHPLSSAGLSSDELLFFDTETTGLGGGVGNTIFLIGCGRVLPDRVVIKQFFLPSPADEVALYQAFLTDVVNLKNLVTYNGRAFDWPQIKTRHTFLRNAVPNLPAFGHFDLLHAARRLWKNTLDSHRLSVVEQNILRLNREEDIPGHLVPIHYFEYVKTQNPEVIEGVLKHNENDILSLITLYTHLSKLVLRRIPATREERYEIGRWHAYLNNDEQALEDFSHAAVEGGRIAIRAKKEMAMIYKRQKRYDDAMRIWHEIADTSAFGRPDIWIEMAKAYEHHYKDFARALDCAMKAYEKCRDMRKFTHAGTNKERETVKRINRLKRKQTL